MDGHTRGTHLCLPRLIEHALFGIITDFPKVTKKTHKSVRPKENLSDRNRWNKKRRSSDIKLFIGQ